MSIAQDDDDDKDNQISQMHQIYRNASLTIVAAEAEKSLSGFLQPRSEYLGSKVAAKLDDNVLGHIYLAEHRDGGYPARFEDTRKDFSRDPTGRLLRRLRTESQQTHHRDHPMAWVKVVNEYSTRALSNGEDKLPAIAAIAEEYSRIMPVTKYYAGLWAEDFLASVWSIPEHVWD
ncbi:hypothetical protein QBC44DRAFT_369361 [Cladorrhinum sp. PSN332]|nr:hypothetical protein QBC44DRAFT_369361 [Cladorrhinum sp. PSN332]